ncbi:MAG: hypothetical protein Hals2KO_20440 [Halioglobus sp.]
MNKFNLTFSGEIQSDQSPDEVKRRFAELFGIDDNERLQRFFSGKPIVLRRHLDRKEAAQWFQDMRRIGAYAELVKVPAEELEAEQAAEAAALLEKQQREAEEKKQAQREESKRKREASAIAAREKAEKARLAREAAAQKKAQQAQRKAEQQRQREEKARQKRERAQQEAQAKRAEAQRLAAEASAQKAAREATQAAALKKAQEKAAKAAAQEAKQEAAKQEIQRKAQKQAEERARKKAAAAKEKSRREAAERRAAQEATRRQAEEAARARSSSLAASTAESARADAARKAAEEAARAQVLEELQQRKSTAEALQQQKALEEQAITRGASELARGVKSGSQQSAPRTRVDLPQRRKAHAESKQAPPVRKRQPGEPNLYTLNAFRVSQSVRERGPRADVRRRSALLLTALALLALFAGTVYYDSLAPLERASGVDAVAADATGQLYLLAGRKLFQHDRAGLGQEVITLTELGIDSLSSPLHFLEDGSLMGLGTLARRRADAEPMQETLLHCDLKARQCNTFSAEIAGRTPVNFHPHPIDGSVFLVDSAAGELLRLDSQGKVVNRATLHLPATPTLRPDSGLILLNSAKGPAISVYRYDRNAFGQQLDEILLVSSAELTPTPATVIDFVRTGATWWALMTDGDGRRQALYTFNEQWDYQAKHELDTKSTKHTMQALGLSRWGDKLLVYNRNSFDVARFSARGEIEAPFVSELLRESVAASERAERLRTIGSRIGFSLLVLTLSLAAGWAYLNHLRTLVYKSQRLRGAQPIDDIADQLKWIPPAPNRTQSLRARSVTCAVLAVALCLVAMGVGASALQLAALLCALAGVALFVVIPQRSPCGHIAVYGEQLLLVDHDNLYHLGTGSDIHYRGNFIMIADVVVYAGSFLWPSFDISVVRQAVVPLAAGGIRIDRKTLWVKLAERWHPLLQGSLCLLLFSLFALVLLGIERF